jgi:hypothetical protein
VRNVKPSAGLVVATVALFVALGSGAVAATGLITNAQLAPNSVWHRNIGNGSVRTNNLRNGSVGHNQLTANSVWNANIGSNSVRHANMAGNSVWHASIGNGSVRTNNLGSDVQGNIAHGGFAGAFYSVQQYTGTTANGAIATAACDPSNDTNSQKYVAISGGVQAADANTSMKANPDPLPVVASFAGRMNFTTSTPLPGRVDGWIIQFGQRGTSDTNISVWALCVPVAIPVMTHSPSPTPY